MARSGVALCEGSRATAKLFEIGAPTWDLRPFELQEFLDRHRSCAAQLGDRPCVTLHIVN
jgi:hypothetical protein